MAKRDPEIEAAEAEPVPETPPTVGERLRVAREKQKISLEDLAAQTRIPQRHLASIETSQWDSLPAPTYTIGFAKNYAAAVGLDRVEIGEQLREEMGGQRFTTMSTDVFEPADPRRTMPKSLVIGAVIAAILLIALMSFLNRRSLDEPDQAATNAPAATPSSTTPPATPPAPASQGAVVLTAVAPVWLQVSEKGGATLFSGVLQPGQAYPVPASATAPVLKTGKPEALKITVGNNVAGPVGPPATTVADVSLLPADLLRGPAAAAPAVPTASPPAAAPAPRSRRTRQTVSRSAPQPTSPPATETPPTTNTGQ